MQGGERVVFGDSQKRGIEGSAGEGSRPNHRSAGEGSRPNHSAGEGSRPNHSDSLRRSGSDSLRRSGSDREDAKEVAEEIGEKCSRLVGLGLGLCA